MDFNNDKVRPVSAIMKHKELEYTITSDPNYLGEESAIPPELSKKLEHYYGLVLEGKRSSVQKFLDAIEQYPDNPQLKNFLSALYGQLNENQKMFDVNKWIIAEHPNYLFGKLNLANEYYIKGEYDKIPEILGPDMELKSLYPNRDIFHTIEVISFFKTAILYFIAIGDIEQAEIRFEIMDEIAPDAAETEFAMNQLVIARMRAAGIRFEKEQETKISVNVGPQKITNISKAPNFNHQEIEWLYNNGLYIEEEKLKAILALPRETLIQDLEVVLQDSIIRYGYFVRMAEEDGWEEEKMNFLIHSLFLLGELNAAESINAYFNILSQSKDYLEFYFGDFITSVMWEPLFKIAADNLEECKEFIFKPGNDAFARTVVTDMLEQIYWHYPKRQEEVLNWHKEVIQYFLKTNIEDNIIDSDLIALQICTIMNISGKELLPEIEKLFDREIVSKGICGEWNEVCEELSTPKKNNYKREILSIINRYKEITSTWASYQDDDYGDNIIDDFLFEPLDYFSDYENDPINLPIIAAPKIGRNDPCPCGSGKKYKKCCLNN